MNIVNGRLFLCGWEVVGGKVVFWMFRGRLYLDVSEEVALWMFREGFVFFMFRGSFFVVV